MRVLYNMYDDGVKDNRNKNKLKLYLGKENTMMKLDTQSFEKEFFHVVFSWNHGLIFYEINTDEKNLN